MAILLSTRDLPDGFDYPAEFIRVVECGLTDLEPWKVLTGDQLFARLAGLRERYPNRELVPFAARQDNDDVACWDPTRPGEVLIVHDFASPGFEDQGGYSGFTDWLRAAFDDFIDWVS